MSGRSRAALQRAVDDCERLRRAFSPSDVGPFIIAGDPKGWGAAAEAVQNAGRSVVAYRDARLRSRRVWFGGRPVLWGRRLGPLARFPLLFAGTPKKEWFNHGDAALERCLWHVEPSGWRALGKTHPELIDDHGDALGEVYDMLEDDASRTIFASLVRGRVAECSDYFRVSRYREYDHPIVRARPGDVVIDAGAYDGDSARWFAWRMRGRGKIVALEPSEDNFAKLSRRWVPNLVPLCVGAWNERTTLSFAEDGGSGRLKKGGGVEVRVEPIDRIVADQKLPRVDVIKLDVEGAEREALEGARETIREHRPKLMVSIYHRQSDLFELPLMLRSWLTGYRFYVGHHNFYQTETDLYAIPHKS